jgi:hypothetical protein
VAASRPVATIFSVLYPGQRPQLPGVDLTGEVERLLAVMDVSLGDANLALALFEQQMHVDRFARRATATESRQALAALRTIESERLAALAPAPSTVEEHEQARDRIRDDVAVEKMQGRAGMGILPDAVMFRRSNMYARSFLFAADGIVGGMRALAAARGMPDDLKRRIKSERRVLEAKLGPGPLAAAGLDDRDPPAVDALVGADVYVGVRPDRSQGRIAVNSATLCELRDGIQRVVDEFEWQGPRHRSWWTA